MYSKIKTYSKKNYLVIYFKKNGGLVRYNTYMRVSNRKLLTKDGLFKENVPNSKEHNKNLMEIKSIVDQAIGNLLSKNPNTKLDNKKVKDEIKNIKYYAENKDLIGYYDDFLKYKFNQIQLKEQSRKDYITLKNSLIDFETYLEESIQIENLNYDFVQDFIKFMEIPHISTSQKKYKTWGELSANTIKKRIDNLKEFLHFLDDNKIHQFDVKINQIKINTYETPIITLDKDEINTLKKVIQEKNGVLDDTEKTVMDSFIFNLNTGLRYSDLASLDKLNFQSVEYNGKKRLKLTKILNKNSVRNRSKAVVSLNQDAEEIIRKYNYHFPLKSNQEFNRTLKSILSRFDLFSEEVHHIKMKTQTNIKQTVLKRQAISSHTCRRSFITNLLKEGTPISSIMGMTGHKKLDTLRKYIDKFSTQDFQYTDKL